jgi:hypothetical protein
MSAFTEDRRLHVDPGMLFVWGVVSVFIFGWARGWVRMADVLRFV